MFGCFSGDSEKVLQRYDNFLTYANKCVIFTNFDTVDETLYLQKESMTFMMMIPITMKMNIASSILFPLSSPNEIPQCESDKSCN